MGLRPVPFSLLRQPIPSFLLSLSFVIHSIHPFIHPSDLPDHRGCSLQRMIIFGFFLLKGGKKSRGKGSLFFFFLSSPRPRRGLYFHFRSEQAHHGCIPISELP